VCVCACVRVYLCLTQKDKHRTHTHTFDEKELEYVEDHEQREEGVAVHVKGVAPLDVLLYRVRHVLPQKLVGHKPAG
jgi:hypothetical protein